MKVSIILYCCVALLPPIIYGGSNSESGSESNASYHSSSIDEFEDVALNEAQAKVDRIVRTNGIINNVFRPTQFLGRGGFSNTYKGELVRGHITKTVAMKFSPREMLTDMEDNEYEVYTYLKAIGNSTVENYGIPAVYYYGQWEGCTLIAITLLDSRFNQLFNHPQSDRNDIDIFIICREYVRISKYVHRCGVCHEDTKLENMMFRNNRGFLIDFGLSEKVLESMCSRDCRNRDWESFLFNVCWSLGMEVDWKKPMNVNRDNTVKAIAALPQPGLKKVLEEFARYAFRAGPINYNRMHQIITREIQKRGVPEPALVSWLTDVQRNEALLTPSPDIRSIDDPATSMTDFIYPQPNLNFFANHH